jgi:hypothetical protein
MFCEEKPNIDSTENQKIEKIKNENLEINPKTKMEKTKNIRPTFFAGSFYSSVPNELNEEIKRTIDSAQESNIKEDIKALILPHAGYIYSGLTA